MSLEPVVVDSRSVILVIGMNVDWMTDIESFLVPMEHATDRYSTNSLLHFDRIENCDHTLSVRILRGPHQVGQSGSLRGRYLNGHFLQSHLSGPEYQASHLPRHPVYS